MEYRTFGWTPDQVSSIGLGCVTFGREIDEATSFTVMDRAREHGINLFDTAEAYAAGASENVVGRWLAARGNREDIFLCTKVNGTLTRERVLGSAAESLTRLQTQAVDLFQVHRWDAETPLAETLGALNTLVEEGKTRYIGCSNYSAEQLATALAIQEENGWAKFVSVQPNYNLVERGIEADLLPLCAEKSLATMTYSPLGAGFLTGKYRQDAELPKGTRFDILPGHQAVYFKDAGWRVVEGLRTISESEDIPMPLLALAWVIGQPNVTTVLIGARNNDQIDQAFTAEAMGLSQELRARLSNL
ncbi:MAG: aldo/keto reductase [Litorilinea sp.]